MGNFSIHQWPGVVVLLASTVLASLATAQTTERAPSFEGQDVAYFQSATPQAQSQAPALIIRPSVNLSEHLNNCVVEMNHPNSSSDRVTLRITVPESVDVIEVVPNQKLGSSRDFRVRVDRQPISGSKDLGINPSKIYPTFSPLPEQTSRNPPSRFTRNPFFNTMNHQTPEPPIFTDPPMVTQTSGTLPEQSEKTVSTAGHSIESIQWKSAKFIGPDQMGIGKTSEFAVSVPAQPVAGPVEIELKSTEGFEVVVVERPDNVIHNKQTINWKLSNVKSDKDILIRYKAKAKREGYFVQVANIRVGGKTIDTVVQGTVIER